MSVADHDRRPSVEQVSALLESWVTDVPDPD
jgi:hypothetical protein